MNSVSPANESSMAIQSENSVSPANESSMAIQSSQTSLRQRAASPAEHSMLKELVRCCFERQNVSSVSMQSVAGQCRIGCKTQDS